MSDALHSLITVTILVIHEETSRSN